MTKAQMEGDSSHDWSFENNDDGEMHFDVDSENNVRPLLTQEALVDRSMQTSTHGKPPEFFFRGPDRGVWGVEIIHDDDCTNPLPAAFQVFPMHCSSAFQNTRAIFDPIFLGLRVPERV